MDERQLIVVNALVGFGLTAGLALLLETPVEAALALGAVAGVGFAAGIWLLGRFEDRRTA